MAQRFPLRLLEPPLGLPRFSLSLAWHPRLDQDPAHRWLRRQLTLAQIHPQLAPLCAVPGGYALDVSVARSWFSLPPARGLAGYGLSRALRMLLDVLAGLGALHATLTETGVGFVHGELTPSAIRVDEQGVARLLPLAPWHWQATELPPSKESLGHLAPERLLGDIIDRRADVFSVGVLLWEALAGSRLFEHDSLDGIVTRLMGGKVLLPELPPELVWAIPLKAVAMRALAVDPEQRFADSTELEHAIEAVSRGHLASHAEVLGFSDASAFGDCFGRAVSIIAQIVALGFGYGHGAEPGARLRARRSIGRDATPRAPRGVGHDSGSVAIGGSRRGRVRALQSDARSSARGRGNRDGCHARRWCPVGRVAGRAVGRSDDAAAERGGT